MGFIETMKERGMLAQVTHEPELVDHLNTGTRTAYAGFDPTADSLHVGHLLPVLGLRRWQQAGHRAIALCGGGTTMVGDPTGKTEMRQMLTEELIDSNIEKFKKQLSRFLDFSSEDKGLLLNNAEWLKPLGYLPFLREIGPHFSVNRMLTADCFKTRLEKGLSFLEFNYMLFQSYDFYELYRKYDCTVQIGGDDQWSNMLGGMELVRRKERGQAFCATMPLLVTSSGKKMGKTESGAVWIDPDKTSPYDLFQYFRNMEDDIIATCLYYFSDLPVQDIRDLTTDVGSKINDAKVVLAFEATKLIHGEEEASKAKSMASQLFSGKSAGADAPECLISSAEVGDEISILDLMVLAKIFPTKSEARRMIQQGGLTVDDKKINDIKDIADIARFSSEDGVLVKRGKKSYFRVKIS